MGNLSRGWLTFTVAAIYDSTVIDGQQVRSMSMLTINADHHPFMSQFHKPEDEKRSIIVIPEEYREDWLNCKKKMLINFSLKCRSVNLLPNISLNQENQPIKCVEFPTKCTFGYVNFDFYLFIHNF